MQVTVVNQETRDQVASELQPLLADLISLAMQGKQAHWNVRGPFFSNVHAQLDGIVDDARAWSDEVAERLVTIGISADGQAPDVAKQSELDLLPKGYIRDEAAIALIADRVEKVVTKARRAMDELGDLDLASQDLVIGIVRGLEKHLWMLRAQQG